MLLLALVVLLAQVPEPPGTPPELLPPECSATVDIDEAPPACVYENDPSDDFECGPGLECSRSNGIGPEDRIRTVWT